MRILPKQTRKSYRKNKQKLPRSCTLVAVHDSILEDLVFPSEIVGKRIRVKLDGSRLIKVHLDKAQQNNVEHKVGAGLPGRGQTQTQVRVRSAQPSPAAPVAPNPPAVGSAPTALGAVDQVKLGDGLNTGIVFNC